MPAKSISEGYIRPGVETHQTDAPRNSGRKRAEDVHGWAQPLRQPVIATVRFVKFLNLNLKDGEYGSSRITILQLGGERMREKVLLGLLLVGLQRCLENCLEARLGGT